MVVFYTVRHNGTRCHDFIRWLGDCVCEVDISYWAVPGTLDLED